MDVVDKLRPGDVIERVTVWTGDGAGVTKPRVRLVALDIDGTLLRSDKTRLAAHARGRGASARAAACGSCW